MELLSKDKDDDESVFLKDRYYEVFSYDDESKISQEKSKALPSLNDNGNFSSEDYYTDEEREPLSSSDDEAIHVCLTDETIEYKTNACSDLFIGSLDINPEVLVLKITVSQ